MTLLVTGAAGQLGTALCRLRPDALGIDVAELDLTEPALVQAYLQQIRPDAIVNCAAYTAVDRAESDEALATAINGTAVGVMAEFAAAAGIPLITFSTDYVFDGTAGVPYLESDPTSPINAYGRSKLAGERAALATHPGALVIRTSWLISGTHGNFVATMLRLAPERDLKVVDDQQGCPTVASDLAAATLAALDAGASGVLHLTNTGATTWYKLARAALEFAGIDPDRVRPCTTAEYPTPAPRPAYSVLGSERRSEIGIAALPPWQDSLEVVVAQLLARG